MESAKSPTGNDEITSKGFLVELANLERKISAGLLDQEVRDVPTDNLCQESTHNAELAKAWKEVNKYIFSSKFLITK